MNDVLVCCNHLLAYSKIFTNIGIGALWVTSSMPMWSFTIWSQKMKVVSPFNLVLTNETFTCDEGLFCMGVEMGTNDIKAWITITHYALKNDLTDHLGAIKNKK